MDASHGAPFTGCYQVRSLESRLQPARNETRLWFNILHRLKPGLQTQEAEISLVTISLNRILLD